MWLRSRVTGVNWFNRAENKSILLNTADGLMSGISQIKQNLKMTGVNRKMSQRMYEGHPVPHTQAQIIPWWPIRPTALYLIILAVGVVAATGALLDTVARTQDEAMITHTGLCTGPPTGGRSSSTSLLAGACTKLIVAVGRAGQS